VVSVHSHRSLSSGFFWRPGLIVTSDEALAEEGEVGVTHPGGERYRATIAGRDPSTDVALLRTGDEAGAAVALSSSVPRTGDLALTVGARGGEPLSGFGIVASVGPAWRSMRGGAIDARIELSQRLPRHAEGSLVLDAGGRSFGMAVRGPRRRTLVIPAATIERAASRLEKDGRIPRAYLGLGLHPARDDTDGALAAMIMSVDKNGPGAAAGCRQGDLIVSWNGQPLAGLGVLFRSLGPDSVGEPASLELRRGAELISVTLTVGEGP
jgi:S1-C subfamily serine protease